MLWEKYIIQLAKLSFLLPLKIEHKNFDPDKFIRSMDPQILCLRTKENRDYNAVIGV